MPEALRACEAHGPGLADRSPSGGEFALLFVAAGFTIGHTVDVFPPEARVSIHPPAEALIRYESHEDTHRRAVWHVDSWRF